jgi:large subunit ribosomal protein L6
MPIKLPSGVTVKVGKGEVIVSGPKGKLKQRFDPTITIKQEGDTLLFARLTDSKTQRALHGLVRSLTASMVQGVTQGFEKALDIVGIGYRAEKDGEKIVLRVGFSHPVVVEPIPGTTLVVENPNRIKVIGIDKQVVGQMAAEIRAVRSPDSYKGKGIRYAGEAVKLKAGKAVGKATI